MTIPVLALLLVPTVWILAGLASIVVVKRRHFALDDHPPEVSVLKPLRGLDQDLERCLETFFTQDHPKFELVFGVTDANDPALQIVERLRGRYPNVTARVCVHSGVGALNPKVDNLAGLLPIARYDLVLVSDSNIRAPRDYLREAATLYRRYRPGLVTHLFAGVDENGLGSALENVQLTGFCAAGTALPTLLGDSLLVGKSALFSRYRFDRLGGLRRLADVLAEDFVMGKTFAHAGERVLVASTILENVTRGTSLKAMCTRHLRWSMLRFRLRPAASMLEPLVNPVALLPLAYVALGPWSIAWALSLSMIRDCGGWLLLRGPRRLWIPLLLSLPRDLLILGVWAVAPFKKHVAWRGQRFRLGAGTLLYTEPERSARRPRRPGPNHPCGIMCRLLCRPSRKDSPRSIGGNRAHKYYFGFGPHLARRASRSDGCNIATGNLGNRVALSK